MQTRYSVIKAIEFWGFNNYICNLSLLIGCINHFLPNSYTYGNVLRMSQLFNKGHEVLS